LPFLGWTQYTQGFYLGLSGAAETWKPLFSKPLVFKGDYQLTIKSQVLNRPLLILHFLLVGIDPLGLPPRLINEHLSGYLKGELLQYKEITFDLSTIALIKAHETSMKKLVSELSRYA